jgi:hypothetical protein
MRLFRDLLVLLVGLPLTAAICYHPDGTSAESRYAPCNSGKVSMCCATNEDIDVKNICRPDGLCAEGTTNFIWRESCSDPTWKDPNCLQLCTSGIGEKHFMKKIERPKLIISVAINNVGEQVNLTTDDINITLCPDGSYCCGFNNTACCSQFSGYWIKDGKVYQYGQNPYTASSSTGSFISSFTNSTTTPSPSPTSKSNGSSGNAVNVGLDVGLGAGLPIIIIGSIIAVVLYRKWRWRRNQASEAQAYYSTSNEIYQRKVLPESHHVVELPAQRHTILEAPSTRVE